MLSDDDEEEKAFEDIDLDKLSEDDESKLNEFQELVANLTSNDLDTKPSKDRNQGRKSNEDDEEIIDDEEDG